MIRELTDADLPAVIGLCGEALDLPEDAAEAPYLVRRLWPVPAAADPGPTATGQQPTATGSGPAVADPGRVVAAPGPGATGPGPVATDPGPAVTDPELAAWQPGRPALGAEARGAAQGPGTRRSIALAATGELPGQPAEHITGVAIASLSSRDPTTGHVDLVAVHPRLRRRGIGRALLAAAETTLAGHGATEVLLAGNLPYAWPGIDVRYTPAVCAALASGYDHNRTAWNMTVELSGPGSPAPGDISPTQDRLAAAGIALRRAAVADVPALTGFILAHFSPGWVWEAEQSIGRDTAGCHLAVRGGEILGFAAYGALRPSWFGPTGTAPSAQGLGIGGVLLRRCLADLRAAGHVRAQIGWVGPVPFYSRTVGAYIERVFFLYRKEL